MSKSSNKGSGGGAKTKELAGSGKLPLQSAQVGGIGNGSSPSYKKAGKVGSFSAGGKVGVGGFRNNGMVNRR